ncbi:MAG: transporter [Xanthomonadaceae bacterium]|nr:transporter [Xanthomonadaceae bacterium]MBU6476789.1 transporter [Xanthomonadaceae bacterium]MDE2054728.1 transporter [Xanthomonadaceae bacterium]MDE2225192.1 transporter [Xanthomonadaceae bacterium]MDE2498189.1 transporter [Xanthomonadaceae bacterium]
MACLLGWLSVPAFAQTAPVVRQSRGDAWFTGPMLANSAETLPAGHFLIEPYFYDVATAHADGWGSRAYLLYGLADRFTVGLIPIVGYNRLSGGGSSSGVGMADLTVDLQYRLTEFREGSAMPTIAIQLQQAFPTGRYDRLGDRPGNGLGSGAYATTLGLLTQDWFWLPNGRILRARFNLSQTFSSRADVQGVSVYGTGAGFRGHARPGSSFYADAALEYSLTRNWVLALDVTYTHNRNTRVTGDDIRGFGGAFGPSVTTRDSGPSVAFGFAPAVEYNWTPNLGVLVGVRVIPGNRSTTSSITPAVAINYVH